MEINLSKHAGFCDGVDRAYKMVEKIASDPFVKKPIAVLGSIVHNTDVVKRIEKLGVRKIDMSGKLEDILEESKGKIGTLVITAHGMGPKIYSLAKQKGFELVDTTCPRVTKVQRLAKVFFDRMSQIVIVGERDHKEVRGIFEWAQGKAQFVENAKDLEHLSLDPKRKIVVLSQTTQNQDFVEHAGKTIREKYPEVEIVDSICLATHDRQSEVKKLAENSDVMIIIGSRESANSTRLWEISDSINKRSHFIERADQLEKKWFASCKKVGISAGASTPKWVIEEVVGKIGKL